VTLCWGQGPAASWDTHVATHDVSSQRDRPSPLPPTKEGLFAPYELHPIAFTWPGSFGATTGKRCCCKGAPDVLRRGPGSPEEPRDPAEADPSMPRDGASLQRVQTPAQARLRRANALREARLSTGAKAPRLAAGSKLVMSNLMVDQGAMLNGGIDRATASRRAKCRDHDDA
jgi:hypothetical protein